MSNLIVTGLNGETELLTNYKELTRTRRVNAERYLSFSISENERNSHSFPLVQEEAILEFDGQLYRIKSMKETTRGIKRIKKVEEAEAKFIGDLIDGYQYNKISGSKSIDVALSHALEGTGYTFVVVDGFNSREFENLGGDNPLALINNVLERYGAEMTVDDKEKIIRVYSRAERTTDAQFRYKYNLKAIEKEVNTKNLSTYIKGYGKENEDGTFAATAEYTSPNADKFPADTPDGLRHAPPVYDERFTDSASLKEELKERIIDTPEITFTVDLVQLQDGGFEGDAEEGDNVFVIHEPLEVDITARIMQIKDFPKTKKPPQITLSNYKNSIAEQMADANKRIRDMFDQSGAVRREILDAELKRIADNIKAAQTEVDFNNNGIVTTGKDDPNEVTIYNSRGFLISTDGGATAEVAVDANGVATPLLTSGTIHTNHIKIASDENLFYWNGTEFISIDPNDLGRFARIRAGHFYAAKGAVTVERQDGFKTIIDGYSNFNVSVSPHDPPFTSAGVEKEGFYYKTLQTVKENINFYTFRHEARYLKLNLAHYVQTNDYGVYGTIYVDRLGQVGGENIFSATYTNAKGTADDLEGRIYTVDLGPPTGNAMSVYLRLKTSSEYRYVYLRNRRMWLEG